MPQPGAPRTLDVTAEYAWEVDLGTVALEPSASLACRIRDVQGNPLSATFQLGRFDSSDGQPRSAGTLFSREFFTLVRSHGHSRGRSMVGLHGGRTLDQVLAVRARGSRPG